MGIITKAVSFFTGGWMGWLASLAGLAAIVGAIWFGFHSWTESLRQEGRDEIQADWDLDANERRLAAAGREETERVKGAQHAIDLAKEREQRKRDTVVIDTVRTATAGTFNGLRDTSAAVTARLVQACTASATGPGIDGPAEAGGAVFAECAGRRETLAGEAEELAQLVRGLQAYAASALMLCGAEPERPVVAEP